MPFGAWLDQCAVDLLSTAQLMYMYKTQEDADYQKTHFTALFLCN